MNLVQQTVTDKNVLKIVTERHIIILRSCHVDNVKPNDLEL